MATIRLIPSKFTSSNASYVTFSDSSHPESNMYANTDSTTYTTIRGRNRSNNTYYGFLHGFNFDDIPSNATVTGFTIKLKAYRNSYQQTGSSYNPRLASQPSNSYVISNTTLSTALGTSANPAAVTMPTGTLTWNQIVNYGDDFSIEFVVRPNTNQYPYYYIYGAEIEVTYTLPVSYNITASTDGGTISPSGTTSVFEGDSYTLLMNVINPTVKDNNVDVTSQIERVTSGTDTFIPYDYTSSGFTLTNIDNAYTDISDSSYADCSLAGRTTGNLYLDLGPISLPSSATITSVTCKASLQISRNGSSSSMTASCQMYSGSTAKGSSTTLVSSAQDVARTTYTLNVGSWTVSELQNARFYVTMYNGASSTVRHIYVYGVSFTIEYTISGEVYTYTITNVMGNHTIVVTQGEATSKIYLKKNGT